MPLLQRDSRVTPSPAPDTLRAAGRSLDQPGRRRLSLAVVADGIVVVVAAHDIRHAAEAVLLPHNTLHTLATQARTLRGRDSRDRVRARLRAVGRYMDERVAHAIVVQERSRGYVVAFTGWLLPQGRTSDLRGLSRLTEQHDDRRLLTLAA